jgi:hypothetical protein
MSSGRGGTSRRGFRHREHDGETWTRGGKGRSDKPEKPHYDKNRGVIYERPKWSPPKISAEPIPAPVCPYCGRPIRDLSAALTDKNTGEAVHFDCVIGRIAEGEVLEKGDSVIYIGGGRFGVVHFPNSQDARNFKIKKILEWENREDRAPWRRIIADHFSVT